MKFTFKTENPAGKYKSFFNKTHFIKLNKISVGLIEDKTYKIRLQVIKKDINEDRNLNCSWRWITLKRENKSLQEAKDFLNKYFIEITTKYNLYKGD